jgi:GNAT superfamily N-acetyltransferase
MKGIEMLEIRKAEMEDEASVFELLKKFPPENIPDTRPFEWDKGVAAFRGIVGDDGKGTVLLAVDRGALLGICSLSYPTAIHCGGIYSCIEEFIVSEKSRGMGVGGKLLEAAIAWTAERDCYEIQVNRPSELGYPVYLRHGFLDAGKHLLMRLPRRES